jgi:hypothetical protein
MAVNRQLPRGVREQGLSLMSDHGCQPASTAFMDVCTALEVPHTFTRDNNPQGHADTERVRRTLKEECLWPREWRCPVALVGALEPWITYDNEQYLHSALGYKPPSPCEWESYSPQSSVRSRLIQGEHYIRCHINIRSADLFVARKNIATLLSGLSSACCPVPAVQCLYDVPH